MPRSPQSKAVTPRRVEAGAAARSASPPAVLPRALALTPGLVIGVEEIDDDHRVLLAQSNALLELLADRSPWANVVALAAEMRTHCLAHFVREERIMCDSGYQEAAAHAQEHRRIEHDLHGVMARLAAGDDGEAVGLELVLYLRSTLIDHLLRHDLKYKSHLLHARDASSRPR